MRRRGLLAALAMPALRAWPSRPGPAGPSACSSPSHRAAPRTSSAATSPRRSRPRFGQNVVVENRTGGNGAVAIVEMTRAAPDGHTICMSISTLITQALLTKQPYDPINDVTPILHLANVGNIVVVNQALPIHSLAELVAYAKANPGRLSYGSPGIGSSVHLSGELFSQAAGIQMVHVPYRGGGPALADLVAGNIQLMFGNASSTLPFVRGGSVRPLAVTSATRQAYAPELPTIAEVRLSRLRGGRMVRDDRPGRHAAGGGGAASTARSWRSSARRTAGPGCSTWGRRWWAARRPSSAPSCAPT